MPKLNDADALYLGTQDVDRAYLGGNFVYGTPTAPANLTVPVVSGASATGDTATTTNGTWTGSPTSYERKWQENISSVWTDIVGETGTTYLTTAEGTFRSAVRATNAVGTSDWAYSNSFVISDSVAMATFSDPNAYLALSLGNTSATYTGVTGNVGNCFSSAPIEEPTYIEVTLTSTNTSAGAAFQLYNGTLTTAIDYAPFGQWYEQPGATLQLTPSWSLNLLANNNIPGYAITATISDLGYDTTMSHRLSVAVRPNGRVWVWSTDGGGGWYGGGNPASDTTPTFILPGTGDLRFGAASNAPAASVLLLHPDDYIYTATRQPVGFRAGVVA